MNTPREEELNDLMMIAATLCKCSLGSITFLEEEHQALNYFYGLVNSDALPYHAIAPQLLKNTDTITIIEDLRTYIFSSDSKINSFKAPQTFYVGCPLIAKNGKCLGALSFWDTKPQKLTIPQKKSLKVISSHILKLLDLENKSTSNCPDLNISAANEFYKNIIGENHIDTVMVDFTEDKNREEQLIRLNKKLNQAQEIAKLGYWNWDLNTMTAYWSDKVYSIFGLEKTEVKPQYEDIENSIYPEDKELISIQRQIAINLDQEFRTENRITLPNGSIKWVLQIGYYTKDAAGNPISYEGTIQDITENKLVFLELAESIQRYTYVTKATSDAIWDLDFKKGKLYWGENYKKLFGHPSLDSAEDDIAYWESKIHPEDRQRVIDSFNTCITKGESNWEEEYRFINVNNEYSNVVDKAFVIRNDKGETIRMVGAIQDVTDKLHAFEELKRSNERFEKVADATNDAIWDWDLVNHVLYQGPGYSKLFGHKPLKYNGDLSSWQKFVHPDDLPLIIGSAERIEKSKTENYFFSEYRYLRSDGSYANVIDRGRVIRNKDGEAIRMVGAMQDVTESKMYQESLKQLNLNLEKQARELNHYNKELEQSEKSYMDLFHLSPQPMWIYDLDTLRFLDVNKSAIEHYGFSYDEFLAMTIKEIRPIEELDSLMEVVNATKKESDRKYKGLFKHQKKCGKIISVEITSSLISHNGKTVRIILAHDITERLKYIEAIVEQNKNLKEIAWVQSHKVRAPLARMMGLIKVMQNNKDEVSHNADFLFDELLKSADELDMIIREISDKASKIEINSKKYELGNITS